jgi:AcrR family transcriptional regulator
MQQPMSTRDRILDAALVLFNEKGTGAVSTNHIAAAAEISPGNLYYHFRNKEEVIRALFERLYEAYDRVFFMPDDRLPTLEDMRRLVRANFEVLWDFRFTYRELSALLRKDPVLHQRSVEVRNRGYEGFKQLVDLFASAGVIPAPSSPEAVVRLADIVWLISEFWLPSLEVAGQPIEPASLERGIELMLHVLSPEAVEPTAPPESKEPPA